jgi:hypothetical protein
MDATRGSVKDANQITNAYIAPVRVGEEVAGITAICARPENALLPITDAMEAFTMQVRGKPASEIEAVLNNARAAAAKAAETKK